MRKNYLQLALAATLTMAATATVSAQQNTQNEVQKLTRSVLPQQSKITTAAFSLNKNVANVPLTTVYKAANPYGEEQQVMFEDFAKMTSGSEATPDTEANIIKDEFEYPWINTKDEYFKQAGWGSGNAYPAGGTVYLDSNPNDMAHINTPMLNVAANGGIAWIRFKARAKNAGDNPQVMVEAAETFNMSPSWRMMGSAALPQLSTEWKEYSMFFYGGGEYTLFNIVSVMAPVYIDNIEVFTVKQHIGTPTTLPHTNYEGTSFDANWTPVEGATGYKVNVFTLNKETGKAEYLFENKPVTTNKFHVTGATSGQTYFYNVAATKDNYTSIPSDKMFVYNLEAPVLKDVTNLDRNKYTAEWSTVPSAERYNYIAYYDRKADKTGEFVVTNEDFTGVKDADGNLTGWTKEDPNPGSYDSYYIPELKQAGWKGTQYAPYTDYICLDGWQYYHNHQDAGLISPEMDMSKDGGKFTVNVKLAGASTIAIDENNNEFTAYTQAAFALFNYNETTCDYEQAELIYPEGYPKAVNGDWKNFTINFTKGSKKSIIGIYAVYADEHLYLDDLKITQKYQAGESLNDPFIFRRWLQEPKVDITIPAFVGKSDVSHRVTAFKTNSDRNVKKQYVESKFSELKKVGTANGISNIGLSKAVVKMEGNNVYVNNINGENVQIYTLDGQLVYNNKGEKNIRVALTQHGAYIVKVGNKTIKLVF
ncbi:T9SS C-terminal target domain-containing protein [Prevotella pallens]|jgi:fibronectin type III domain protein|uniref:T9SS C-terminal target domain-containing protein n=1 Tax=Prevotella pallens TaxID=60133 RepID=UPI001CB36240|nr:T9SS C-terminal target domain-containing protein [Prevotella pallens]MBF1451366.1 T9SS C-terminal target domain-containing protein [Prevotella pallens]MBF1477097.1 T9SS C-terminal target domain-containing protein [Prevotella pallens]MBF1498512.1 T9SS C-terminal target domain-containing protein [Prevotella pallens]MBF1507070.1 T9SS C-terminal target domain-containing protein [Prevotella pallens]